MQIRDRFPRPVREISPVWIPLADGARLAARLWLPEDAARRPVPAVLEYLPYRQRDDTVPRDAVTHPYLAGHGYACLRVDIRGTGDSDGVMQDEYAPPEQDDALEVIAWIARQPWCTGAVGMMGISWGGFNALQVAARRPPALRAIVTVCSTDDRYAGDTHYPGGVWLNGNLGWGAVFLALLTRPPDPLVVGERWRALWQQRLDALEPPVATWLAHQRRDGYWRHGSIGEDYGAIACPTLVVGGFRDGYTEAVARLLGGLTVPRRGILGPWAHAYPHVARPRPAGFLQEVLRWWDQWLRDGDGAGEAVPPARPAPAPPEPMLRAWLEEIGPPDARFVEGAGRWVAEAVWPSPAIWPEIWHLGAGSLAPGGTLTPEPGPPGSLVVGGGEAVGLAGGVWCPYGYDGELPGDQREDDAFSLCFDSAPLAERRELLGTPELELRLAVDAPAALLCARLCAVAPDGASTRLAYGLLNLARREGFDRTVPVVPGEPYLVRLPLSDLGAAIPAGWRLRLALSTGYWPMVWPAPAPARLTAFAGPGATLALPRRLPRPEDAALSELPPPEGAPPATLEVLRPTHRQTTVERDLATGTVTVVNVKDRGRVRFPDHGLVVDGRGGERLTLRPDDPLSAQAETSWTVVHERGSWRIRTESRMTLRADRDAFHFGARVVAFEGEREVFARGWDRRIPRDGV